MDDDQTGEPIGHAVQGVDGDSQTTLDAGAIRRLRHLLSLPVCTKTAPRLTARGATGYSSALTLQTTPAAGGVTCGMTMICRKADTAALAG